MSTPSLVHSVQPVVDESSLSRNERELIIVRRARDGDRTALKGLWDDYRRPIYNFFARSISSREEAEDLTSETMLAVFHNLATFRGFSSRPRVDTKPGLRAEPSASDINTDHEECTFSSFVFSIATNQLRQWLRRKHVRDQRTPSVSHQHHPADGQELESVEWRAADASADPLYSILRREHLDSAYFALADVGMRSCEQFKALIFHYACGLAHKDVASLLGTRKETINARLQEGRNTLKAHYSTRPGQ